MRFLRVTLVVMIALAAVWSVAGCGGDDDSGSTAASSATTAESSDNGDGTASAGGAGNEVGGLSQVGKEEEEEAGFVAEANEACKESRQQLKQEARPIYAQEVNFNEREPVIEEFINDIFIPNMEDQVAVLEELEVPADETRDVDQIVTALEGTLDEAEANPVAFMERDAPFAESEKLAKEIGMRECGHP